MLFTLEFREPKLDGSLIEHSPLHITASAQTFTNETDGHTFFRESYRPLAIMPVQPIVTLKFMDKFMMEFKTDSIPQLIENYDELPNTLWVQLNSPRDRFTVQLRLQKMPREKAIYCDSANAYSVFAAIGVALHINNVNESCSNDLDRLLTI